jgi:hypothetical protein
MDRTKEKNIKLEPAALRTEIVNFAVRFLQQSGRQAISSGNSKSEQRKHMSRKGRRFHSKP